MKIIIDNSAEGRAVFYLKKKSGWAGVEMAAGTGAPLLALLEAALKKHNTALNKLDGIAVVVGSGRFTAARIAVTTANALSYALGIPVAGIDRVDFNDAGRKLKTARPGRYLSATYSAEAHIGGQKRPRRANI